MRRQLINAISICIAFQLFLGSCKKDIDRQSLRPPVSNAGADIYLQLPTDSAQLDGTASFKTDHEISKYQWSKVSGPISYIAIYGHYPQNKYLIDKELTIRVGFK